MKFLREGSMSDVYYTFQDIANNPDYSDIDAIAQIKKVMSHPTDAEQFVARKLKLMHDTIAKHPSYKNDPMGVYEEMLDMIRTEYHDETYESKDMNPTTQTFSEDNDTNSLEQWKADVRKQYPQQASQIKFKGKGFGDTIVAEIPGKDQAFGEFNMETGDAWVAPMDEGVAEGSHSESDEELENFLDSTKPELDRLYKLAKTSKKAKAAYYELKEKWDDANSKLYGLDEQGVAEGSVLDTDTTGYTKYDMAFVNNEINQIKKIQAKLLKIPGFTRKVNDKTSQLQLAEKIFNLMKRGHTFDGALVLAHKNPSQQGVAEGSSSPDEYKRRLASIQSLRYDNPQEYAKQYRALLQAMPGEHAAHANQVQKGSYSSGQRGSGTGSTGRVAEDSAQGTANKQAWDKGHEAGYTGNEKCPCKPGSAEEKAWNAGHKVGRDERSHERHGVKEGNMKSSANNPTGPSFAGGKWKGTDSAAQAKNKYVGEISEGTMPSVKLMRNIAEGLVRVDDLVLNRPVYGKPTDQDRRAVYRMVREFADAGIDYNDAVVELVEYFKHELSELAVAPTIPAVGGKPATTTTTAPTGTPSTTANTAAKTPDTVSSTAPGAAPVVAPPVSQQGVDALAQMVKNAGLSPSQLGTLMSKAK